MRPHTYLIGLAYTCQTFEGQLWFDFLWIPICLTDDSNQTRMPWKDFRHAFCACDVVVNIVADPAMRVTYG